MIVTGWLSGAIVALAVVAGPVPASDAPLSFEHGARPGVVLAERFQIAAASQLTADPFSASAYDRVLPHRARPVLGQDGKRLVARWVGGEDARWQSRLDLSRIAERLQLRPGPFAQLAALLPLCLLLLGRQRRFHQRFVAVALPAHTPASRNLLGSGR